jgi:putative ABC transport system permease protein
MSWWNRLFRRNRMEQQLDKELRFHVEQHLARLIADGSDPAAARRQANLALGGSEQVKEQCRDARGTRWLEDLWQDFHFALRTLRHRPGFSVVALLTLALGIGATTVIFTLVNSLLLKPLSYPEPERLVIVHGFTQSFGEFWGMSNPDFQDMVRQSRCFALAAWAYGGGTVSAPGEPEFVDGRQISSDLFSVLGVTPVEGRAFRFEEDQLGATPVAIISYAFWQRRYGGSPTVVGTTLVFEGKAYTITGVAPVGFQLDGEADVLVPFGQDTEPRMQNRQAHFAHVIARLHPGVRMGEAQAELTLISRNLATQYPQSNQGLDLLARPLQQELVADVSSTLWLLLGAVGLLLLIACVNLASLMLARAVSRQRELAMRFALGAGRGRLIRQCLTESAVLGLSGGTLGALFAAVGVRPFVALWPGSLPRAAEIHLDWQVLLFALAVSFGCGLLFGLAPALSVPFRNLDQPLRSGARTIAGSAPRIHRILVTAEIALAVVLLVSAAMLGHALLRLSSLDPGFNVQNVLAARFALSPSAVTNSAEIRAAWQGALDRARSAPGVESAALADIIPMREGDNSVGYSASSTLPAPNQTPVALASSVTPDYWNVMGIPLRHGRFFDEHDRLGSQPVVVIDENLAQHAFGESNPVGKSLWIPAMGASPLEIVGVVGHVRHWGLARDDNSRVRDQIYCPLAQVPDRFLHFFSSVMSIAVRTRTPPLTIVELLKRELRGATRDQVLYDVRTMEQLVALSLARQHFLLTLFAIFAALAVFLACIGLYGVLAYLTGRRIPEMGLRVALGATPREVQWLVLRESLIMILLGITFGLWAALAATRVLVRTVEGMRSEPAILVLVIPVLVLAALLASWLPAYRAGRVDPVLALRQD